MDLKKLMKYVIEILRRNPEVVGQKNLKIEQVVTFCVGDKVVGARINYSYGIFNQNFRTEDFPTLPPEWDLHEDRVCFVHGHIGTDTFFPPTENKRDVASRQAILAR